MSSLDIIFNDTYKTMFGVDTLNTDSSSNTIFKEDLTINSNLYISGKSYFNNSLICNSDINISNISILQGNTTFLSTLNVSSNSIFNNNAYINNINILNNTIINNNLTINKNTILTNNVTQNNNLNTLGISKFENSIITSHISSGNTLNIMASIINIGNNINNSIISIKGTTTYFATTELKLEDKILTLNLNSADASPADIGYSSGIEFLGTRGSGFLKTTNDALRYLIKAPINNVSNYISMLDINNNLIISGNTNLNNTVTLLSSLNISSNTNIINNLTILSNLNVSGNTIVNSPSDINNNLNVLDKTKIIGNINIPLNFTNLGNSLIAGNTTLMTNLNVINNSNFCRVTLNSTINISGNSNLQGSTFLTTLNISNNSNLLGPNTLNSNLVISGYSILSNSYVNNNLNISDNSIINNISLNNSLYISSNSIFLGNVTINSLIYLAGSINNKLYHYIDNTSAKNGGIPIFGLYRIGGVVSVRLNDTPPTVYLSGSSQISINVGTILTDPGSYAIDYYSNTNSVYLISFLNSTKNNLLNNNILILGTSTLINLTSSFPVGNYTATYSATDSNGNIGYNYRLLTIH